MPVTLIDKDGQSRTFRASASAIARYERECKAKGERYSLMDDLMNQGEGVSFDTLDRLCTFIGVESYEAWLDMGFGMEELLTKVWTQSAMRDLGFTSGDATPETSVEPSGAESETA